MTNIEKVDYPDYVRRLEELIGKVDSIPDGDVRSTSLALVQNLLEFHGVGITRMMEVVRETTDSGLGITDRFAQDPVISSLLLLYDLHPVPLETRVANAVEQARPYLQSHGGDVDLLGFEKGFVRLRLRGTCGSCSSSMITLKQTIEEAIYQIAPDVNGIVSEPVEEHESQGLPVSITRSGSRQKIQSPAAEAAL